MLRKMFTLVSLVVVAAFILTACGATPTVAPVATAKPVTPPTKLYRSSSIPNLHLLRLLVAPAEPVTIKWWHISTGESHKALFQKYGR